MLRTGSNDMGCARKPRIFWDLDDTLNNLMQAWLSWRSVQGAAVVAYAELRENPPHRLLGLTKASYLESLDCFRVSDEARHLKPIPAVMGWFAEWGSGFEHHVLTARPRVAVPAAADWVFTHFGQWVRHFHYTPARRDGEVLPDMDEDKGMVIRRLGGAEYFIDDDPKNLLVARAVVTSPLLVPQPWNEGTGSMSDVLAALLSRANH